MKELAILKRSAMMYAFSILFTGLVNFIAIPLLKQKTGSSEYAYLNLYMNLLLVISYIGAGWLVQSCVRFFPVMSEKIGFDRIFKKLAIGSGVATSILAFVTVLFFDHYAWMLVIFPVTLFFINLQTIVISWMQASVRPAVVARAEIFRSLVFLTVIILIQNNRGYNLVVVAWIGWLASYLISLGYMLLSIKKNRVPPAENPVTLRAVLSKFSAFGFPLSLWLVAAYGLLFTDRFILLKHQPAAWVGHYSALFDVLQKGIGFALSPWITAAYPLLARLYEENNMEHVKKLSRKILFWQCGITIVALVGYILAWPVLKKILTIDENEHAFFVSGLFLLAGSAVWQINMLLHKPFELQQKTSSLLLTIAGCYVLFLIANLIVIPRFGFEGAAIVFFSSTLLYGMVILFRRFVKK